VSVFEIHRWLWVTFKASGCAESYENHEMKSDVVYMIDGHHNGKDAGMM